VLELGGANDIFGGADCGVIFKRDCRSLGFSIAGG